jgi:hypothetical protein
VVNRLVSLEGQDRAVGIELGVDVDEAVDEGTEVVVLAKAVAEVPIGVVKVAKVVKVILLTLAVAVVVAKALVVEFIYITVELTTLALVVTFMDVELLILLFVGTTSVLLKENIDKRLLSPQICEPFPTQGMPQETSTRGPRALEEREDPQKHSWESVSS